MSEYKYQSPIEMIQGEMRMHMDGEILKAVRDVGVNVDKDELLKALAYDRDQYNKGYHDAEPKVGKWEQKPYKRQGHEEVVIEGYSWRCSSCGDARKRNEPDMNFCPNCGARMKGEE